jgi:hypothetical protein
MVLIFGALGAFWALAAIESNNIPKRREKKLKLGLVMPKTVLCKPSESSQILTT